MSNPCIRLTIPESMLENACSATGNEILGEVQSGDDENDLITFQYHHYKFGVLPFESKLIEHGIPFDLWIEADLDNPDTMKHFRIDTQGLKTTKELIGDEANTVKLDDLKVAASQGINAVLQLIIAKDASRRIMSWEKQLEILNNM